MGDGQDRPPDDEQLRRALAALRDARERLDAAEAARSEPVAIVGMACRLPGAGNLDGLWELVRDGRDAIVPVPADRWDADELYDGDPSVPGKVTTRFGGFLEGLDCFDAAFFDISPREATAMDPQQRLLLEVAWEALEDAGQTMQALAGSRTGVFVGAHAQSSDYYHLQTADPERMGAHTATGTAQNILAGRLAYWLDLRGPAVVVDTACSSSLVATHLACQSLRAGDCDQAVVGGVNAILAPGFTVAMSRMHMLAPDGRCKTFDASGDGFGRGEGCCAVVVKRLSDALASGDPIHAVVLGSAVNQDGHGNGLTAPSGLAQQAAIRDAVRRSGVEPSAVSYVEAHGTGTPLGDPIEVEAIAEALGRAQGGSLALGSAKANLAHLEGAAGLAGVVKTVLSLRHDGIPPLAGFARLNPHIDLRGTRIVIPTELRPWPRGDGPRVAGVSSFGWSGTNAHVVLGDPPSSAESPSPLPAPAPEAWRLLPISAREPAALAGLASSLEPLLEACDAASWRDVCFTAARRRTQHEHRLAVAAPSASVAAERLAAHARGEAVPGVVEGRADAERRPRVVFVFPGQGSQRAQMGRTLLAAEPAFRASLERADRAIADTAGWSLAEQLELPEGAPGYRLEEIDVLQPALVAVEIALAELWRAHGVEPDAVVGHSMGEVAAAHVAGALTLEEAMRVICARSALLRRISGRGAMAALELSPEEAEAALAGWEELLAVAVVNSPRSTVVAGDPDALTELLATLEAQGVYCRRVNVDVASHSPQVDPLRADLLTALEGLESRAGRIPLYSTVVGEVLEGGELGPAYWAENLRRSVRFAEMVGRLADDGHDLFVELSPHPILLHAIDETLEMRGRAIGSLRRDVPDQEAILEALGSAWTRGADIDWSRLHPEGACVPLPAYPWQRERFWIDSRPAVTSRSGKGGLLGVHVECANGVDVFETELDLADLPYLADHRVAGTVVLPAASYLELAAAAASDALGAERVGVERIAFREAMIVDAPLTVQLLLTRGAGASSSFRILSREAGCAAETPWTLHATGSVRPATGEGDEPAWAADAGGEPVSASEHYAALRSRRLDYGPAFRAVRSLRRGDGEASGELALDESVSADRARGVHPTLIDGCLQVLAALAASGRDTLIPVAVERFATLATPAPGERLVATARGVPGDEGLIGDVVLAGERTGPLLVLQGVELRRIVRDAAAAVSELLWQTVWEPCEDAHDSGETLLGRWLILADQGGVGAALAAELARVGASCDLVHADGSAGLADAVAGAEPVAAVVHLWPLDAPDVERDGLDALGRAEELCCHALTDLLRALDAAGSAPRLAVVTRGSQTVEAAPRAASCGQALAWGLAGAIASERPELEVRRIDLDPSAGVDGEALRRELGAGDEDQVALREGRRYAARLASMELPESPDAVHVVEPGEAVFRLEVETPGLLDSIRLVPAERRAPGPGEVEIEVEAAALNFLDVLKAMGLGPGIEVAGSATLGGECAGRVVAVGAGVESVRPGDAVLAIAPSFRGAGLIASHAVVPAALVTRRPDRLRATEGVTGPIAFLTARIALLERAGLRAGETVLVHSAAGGVGLAAVQVARQAGATVLATAGTEEKRAFLRGLGIEHVMDSRSLSFAEEARIATGGRGVDVVLNSLAGDALRLGLDALAPYGRFVEIGKRDIYAGADLALDAFARSLSFIAVDVARDVTEREAEIGEGLRQIAADLDAGSIEPLPTEIYPVAEAAEAVRRMASGEHTGKVVLETTGAPIPISVPAERAAVRADATYLLTGGLGALGLEAASALVEAGARSLLLVGRREPGDAARAAIAELEARGAAVATASLDVADPEALAIVLDRARRELPPLRGVLHAAGILDDGLAETLDPARFRTVLAPKAYGALTLHRATAGLDLDWFCLYSSAATVLGTPAQGSYAAANAFLEALAHTRRSDGLPALAIDWGSWGEVGLAAAQDARGGRLAARGLDPMASDEATAALRRLLPIESAQVAVMRFDAERWCESYPAARKSSLLRRVAQRPTAPVAGLHELLRATEAGERRSLVEEHLRSHLAAVLRVPADRIPLGSPLQALGLDSLLTIELRNRLRASTGLALGASIIFSYPTVAALAGYVDRSLGGPAAENGAAAAAEAQEPLAALSEHELADLLAEELEGARRQLGGTP